MNPASVVLRTVFAAALLALAHVAVDAQTPPPKGPPPVTKAEPRLPPNAAESGRIPAGVDSGSPATSDTLPLGTPVPPVLGADRSEIRNRSAAARAAARPKLGASAADCNRSAADAGAKAAASAPKAGAPARAASALSASPRAAGDC